MAAMSSRPSLHAPLLLTLGWLSACPAPAGDQDQGAKTASAAGESAPAVAAAEPTETSTGPHFVLAPEGGDVATLVVDERRRAQAAGRDLLVYVGASWCEPCTYFHAAAEDGSLDEVFPTLRLLEFDLDRDRDRLAAAGYESKLIPLFVVPDADGRAGPRRTEGGIKGPNAVQNLTPRLQALLQAARTDGSL